ncbi:hypothetical protein D5F01_LYC14452 [Larimichthys crocea]|uniref:Uncharacterized protein n=1 Tax=Larimichthys crocea TaxID=215358 RepID=A0A6G0I587_LARCR|nr:hypothetical protein D5F01_LYC14452 [Larimichthys crocea]
MAGLWRSYQALMTRYPWTVQIVTAEPETVEEGEGCPCQERASCKRETKAAKKEPAAAKQKKKSEKTEASAVKSKAKASTPKKDAEPEPRPQPIRLRPRLEVRKANVTKEEKAASAKTRSKLLVDKKSKAEKAEKKSVKEAQDKVKEPAQTKESQTEDNTTEKKKTGQRYFQCIYIPGKHAQYPLRPFTPAMSPTVMSPALKSMLDQHRAARTSGQ